MPDSRYTGEFVQLVATVVKADALDDSGFPGKFQAQGAEGREASTLTETFRVRTDRRFAPVSLWESPRCRDR